MVKTLLTQAVLLVGKDIPEMFSFFPELGDTLLKETKNNVLSVYDPKSRIMRFFECDPNETIMKLVIETQGGLGASTTSRLLKLISKHISNLLFSTGFCEEEGACYWEGFFLYSTLADGSLEPLQVALSKVKEISKHEVNQITEKKDK